ncbi:IS110 family transposase [Ensifer aridi]|uniref:IS110 family transposase n=1 Tax=Ensifer aridi TaxID=1708715 RepID=UPI000A109D5D|nr:IS110 family transposase [Ensifer aridi]
MPVATIGLDLAKAVFQAHGVDDAGQTVLRRRLGRSELLAFFAKLSPCKVAMEACSSAHHWARELVRLGHEVRLIPPQYVKPYVKRNKTDAADAEAICEAATRPNMRFVPIKTRDQQAVLALHRSRSLLVRQRTASINAVRGLVGEFGLVAAKGRYRMSELRQRMNSMSPDDLPGIACQTINTLFDHIDMLEEKIAAVERQIVEWHKNNEDSRRLATAPGVGPITASAIVAAVGDGRQFQSARHFAAWLGLTPRIHASGKKERIGRISKGGDRYLRALLIHGARAIVGTLFRKSVTPRPWLLALAARRPTNVTAVAVAHKTARALWAMLTRDEAYRKPVAATRSAA